MVWYVHPSLLYQCLISSRIGKYQRDRLTVFLDHYEAIRKDDPATYTYGCQCGENDGTPLEDGIYGTSCCRRPIVLLI
jgi:hypothetical protein